MNERIVSTRLRVSGVHTDTEVKAALQALYDVFAELGIGQATFEVTGAGTGAADLYVKHLDTVTVDVDAINAALKRAGDYQVVR
jgi:hypothetical protein